ncbi:MAG: hypothetical protein L3K06_03455 [Thermoplasmata archaeon]|nr:hypothetical protein [Thermoplasmata archaeon]
MQAHEWGLALVVVLGAAAAFFAGPNLAVAEPAAAAALLAAAVLVSLTVVPRVRAPSAVFRETHYDTLVLLRESFRQGVMGRAAILSTLSGLEAEVFGSRRASLTLEEEDGLRRASPRAFRAWVDARLTELERAS